LGGPDWGEFGDDAARFGCPWSVLEVPVRCKK